MNHAAKSLTNLMSKVMNIGVPLQDIIRLTTWEPAQLMKRSELGHLTPGVGADVAVLRLVKGNFAFTDIRNLKMSAKEKLDCEVTIRDGNVVWDQNGLTADEYTNQPRPTPTRTQ
jgi:dihydroorotase